MMICSQKKWRRRLCAVLAGAVFALSPLAMVPARADTKAEIEEMKEQLKELEAQVQAQQEVVNELASSKARVVDRKIALDAKIDLTRQQIKLIQNSIEIYDGVVAEKQAELDEAMNAESVQGELLRSRMRAMEESGETSVIAFLFESRSLTDLLSRLADVDDIMHYDQTLETDYREAREDVQALKKSYEESLASQEELRRELDRRTEELNIQVEAACALIEDINEESDDAMAEYEAIDQARAEADRKVDELLARLAAEEEAARRAAAAAAAAQQGASGGGGGYGGSTAVSLSSLIWPVPSCSIITSRFGARSSPTAGASSYHGGLDIGAADGAAIVAAQGGTVILASYNGGYGNCVMINHGNGVVTLYGHMQSYAVSYGQSVSQGQVIGYVGSTGVSTGPHCHFEIRVNGNQTDPAPYFSGLTYYC